MNYSALHIEKMPSGGFLVMEARTEMNRSNFCGPLFASTTIGEALEFIKGQLVPAVTAAPASGEENAALERRRREFNESRNVYDNVTGKWAD